MRKGYPIALKNGISGSIFRYRCNFQYVKNKKRQRNRILRQKNQIENQKENQIEKQKEKQKEKHIKSM